jgi:anti-sigma regulatory factor (Ser/Thr protein kinase)
MSRRDETLLTLTLPCVPSASAAVRDELSRLDDLGWVLGDAMLVASELVNNAILHSGCGPDHDLEVNASRGPGRLTISVRDPGLSGGTASAPAPTERQVGGWGLRLVEALCARWGEEHDVGYRVWAEMSLPGEGRRTGP